VNLALGQAGIALGRDMEHHVWPDLGEQRRQPGRVGDIAAQVVDARVQGPAAGQPAADGDQPRRAESAELCQQGRPDTAGTTGDQHRLAA
jgi:hypothetical protein